jgi:hypothetical protein
MGGNKMSLITIDSLKTDLELKGITHELTDEQLTLLLQNKTDELAGLTNLPILPTSHKEIRQAFEDERYEVDSYPVSSITSLTIGPYTLNETEHYTLDESLGIIYFNRLWNGMLVVEYVSCISDDVITQKVNPLLSDMIGYTLLNGFSPVGSVTSMKEGDVSVNYDTSTSLGNLIQSRINDLKNIYSVRIKVL